MSSIVIAGNTSGAITIAAPAEAGLNTLTLPASTGTVALTSDIPAGGKILQVVSLTSELTFSTTSATAQNTGISLAITPTSSTSKVLVIVSASLSGTASSLPACGIRRDTTIIGAGTAVGSRRSVSSANGIGNVSTVETSPITHLDSPATTAATTYHITISSRSGYTANLNQSNSNVNADYTVSPVSSITLMEIGA